MIRIIILLNVREAVESVHGGVENSNVVETMSSGFFGVSGENVSIFCGCFVNRIVFGEEMVKVAVVVNCH